MGFQNNTNTFRWSRFEECNTDTTTAFENMCRVSANPSDVRKPNPLYF